MKRRNIISILIAVALATAYGYFRLQGGLLWCNRQSTGLALTKSGYRSWSVSYSDGARMDTDGRWHQISFTTFDENGQPTAMRDGYRCVKFHHNSMLRFGRAWGEREQ